MPAKRNQYGMSTTDEEFIAAWKELMSATLVAQKFGLAIQAVHKRRRAIERRYGINLHAADPRGERYNSVSEKVRARLTIENGCVLVGSDCHYWPGHITTAQRAFIKLVQEFKPVAVILNGDVVDCATISRFPRIGWQKRPSVKEELEEAQNRLEEIEKASLNSKLFWTFGNHEGRFELTLAKLVPEYEGVEGFTLKYHFPRWTPCMSVMINDCCIVKHRWHMGIHAVFNNVVKGGISIVTGHLHSLKVTPWTDYRGSRYGVDSGTMADTWGLPFESYLEDSPRNWRSGFAVLNFVESKLMPPELVHVIDENKIWFRGNVIEV